MRWSYVDVQFLQNTAIKLAVKWYNELCQSENVVATVNYAKSKVAKILFWQKRNMRNIRYETGSYTNTE